MVRLGGLPRVLGAVAGPAGRSPAADWGGDRHEVADRVSAQAHSPYMDFDRIGPALDRMVDLLREHELAELEIESDGVRIRMRKPEAAGPPGESAGVAGPARQTAAAPGEPVATVVSAPVVGTFYRAGEPDSAPFVQVGDRVRPGDVLCVIEAMKLMNDIKAEFAGEVVDVLAENGQAVEYGQPLFAILPPAAG